MKDASQKGSSIFNHLLSVVGVGVAILIGFVLGLWVGDRGRKEQAAPASSAWADSLAASLVAVPDTAVFVEPVRDTVPEISESTKKERAEGLDYLTTHNQWNRDEMEKMPALRGLWDAVNHYDVEAIRKYAEIMECPALDSIVEGLDQSKKTGYYASKTDRVITLSTYIRRLRQ